MSMRSLQTNSARSSWRRDERNFIGISWTTNTSKLRNGGSNDCRKFWMSLMCGSQDLTLQAILSNGSLLSGRRLGGCSAQWLLRGRRNGASLCKRLFSSTTLREGGSQIPVSLKTWPIPDRSTRQRQLELTIGHRTSSKSLPH